MGNQETKRKRWNGALMDIPAIAEHLGTNEKAIWALIARGLLPAKKLGGRTVIVRNELEQVLKNLPAAKHIQAST